MTERQLTARIKRWQRRLELLGVAQWKFTVKISDTIKDDDSNNEPDNYFACVDVDRTIDTADFMFRKGGLAELTDREVDVLVVHEWIHVADRDYDFAVDGLLKYLSPDASNAESDRIDAAKEIRTERMARCLVDFWYATQ